MENKKFEWDENKVDELLYHLTKKTRWVHSQMCDWKEEFKSSQLPTEFEIYGWIPKDNVGYSVLLCGDYQSNLLAGYKIALVKRLSDGEMFSIGDEDKKGIIKEFRLFNNILMVVVEGKSTGGTIITSLRKLSKVKEPIPLFTTFDGKKIFENNEYFVVEKHFEIGHGVGGDGYNHSGHVLKTFSTEDAAKTYIIYNKPCLSANDIKWWLEKYFNYPNGISVDMLTKLVKEKTGC